MKTKKSNLNHLIVHLILLAGVAVVVFPFLWMILTSFKTSGEAMKIPPTIFPENFVTTAYHTIVSSAIPFIWNSLYEYDYFYSGYDTCTDRILFDGRLCVCTY